MTRVLLVEDDDDLRLTLAELLVEEGYDLTHARDGREALACIEQERPDVVVLDYMMPTMNGAEFRREQRRRPEMATIPVILMTAAGPSLDLASIQPDAVVTKPFAIPKLVAAIEMLRPGA